MFQFDLQLFGGFVSSLFGGGGSSAPAVAAPSVKTSAPGSVATQTADMDGSRAGVQKRLRRVFNREATNVTGGQLGNMGTNGAAAQVKKLLGD